MNYYDRQELENLELRIKNLETRMDQSLANINNTWAEINDLWMIVLEILKDLELLKVRTSDLEDRMDLAEKEIDQLFQEITFIWGDQTYYTGHNQYNIKRIWLKLGDLDNELLEINNRLDLLDISTLLTRITTLETNVSNIWTKIARIEDDIDNLPTGDTYDDIVIWGDQTYKSQSNQYNIKQIWTRLNTLNNSTVEAFDDSDIWGNATTKSSHNTKNITKIWQAIDNIDVGGDSTIVTMTHDDSTIWGDASTKSAANSKNITKIWQAMSTVSGNSTVVTINYDDSSLWGDASTKSAASSKNITKIWQKLDSISTAPVTISSGGSITPYDDSELRESIYSIWGNERYYTNGESSIKARNIRAIWQHMWNTIWGGQTWYENYSTYNIAAIWNKLNTITSYDDTELRSSIESIWGDINYYSSTASINAKNIKALWNKINNLGGGTTYDDTNIRTSIQNIWGDNSYYNNSSKDIYHLWERVESIAAATPVTITTGGGGSSFVDDTSWRSSIASIWGDTNLYNTASQIMKNNISALWDALDDFETRLDKIEQDLYGTNNSFITFGYNTYEKVIDGITFSRWGGYIKIKDLGKTYEDGSFEFCIQVMGNNENSGGTGTRSSSVWIPVEGIRFPLPIPFKHMGSCIVATDCALLEGNGCQVLGACFYGKDEFGIKRRKMYDDEPEEYNTVTWNAFAIGF